MDRIKFHSELAKLRGINPWYNAVVIGLDWLVIIGVIILYKQLNTPWIYPVCYLLIGGRMMALWSLLHDGHHYMLFPNRRVNRIITHIFITIPLFKSLSKYDDQHERHHRYLRSDEDPLMALWHYDEFQFPMPKRKLFFIILKDLTGYNFIKYNLAKLVQYRPTRKSLAVVLFYLAIFAALTAAGWWQEVLLFWIIPYITWFSFGVRLTIISDHFFSNNDPRYKARSILVNVPERLLIAPHNFSYHAEHHLFGNIPWYNLRKLRRLILADEQFREKIRFSRGYGSVIREVTV